MDTPSSIRVSLVLLATLLLAPAVQAGTTLWQGVGPGRTVEAEFSQDSGGGRIQVFQNGGPAFLFFEIWGNDPASRSCTSDTSCVYTRYTYDYGWGEIPAGDFAFTGNGAHLATTTPPTFSATRCTTDTSGPAPMTFCETGPAATFDLVWTANGFSGQTMSGITLYSIGSFRFRNLNSITMSSAYVGGNANGHELNTSPGRIGTTKGQNIATR